MAASRSSGIPAPAICFCRASAAPCTASARTGNAWGIPSPEKVSAAGASYPPSATVSCPSIANRKRISGASNSALMADPSWRSSPPACASTTQRRARRSDSPRCAKPAAPTITPRARRPLQAAATVCSFGRWSRTKTPPLVAAGAIHKSSRFPMINTSNTPRSASTAKPPSCESASMTRRWSTLTIR